MQNSCAKKITKRVSRIGLTGAMVASLLVAGLVHAEPEGATARVLFKPDLRRELTQAERQKLDFDLANEASMREHNSYRFDAPGSFEKRARWFEETAQWYPIADLMQQIIDFRKSTMRNNEVAFNQLVALGQGGDAGAACLAWMFYRHHKREVTANWKYSFEKVTVQAMKFQKSGHPVCLGIEASLFISGDLGYSKSATRAKAGMLQRAVAGFFGAQHYMSIIHLEGRERFMENDVALYLCWQRVAYAQSPIYSFPNTCEVYEQGVARNHQGEWVPAPLEIKDAARQWCDANRTVTAQTCADLEQKYEPKGKQL